VTIPVVAEVRTPATARESRVDRFLARVGMLTPAQWGELDALAAQYEPHDPIGWWRNARRTSAFASRVPVVDDVLSAGLFVAFGVEDIARLFRRRRPSAVTCQMPAPPAAASPEFRQHYDRLTTLWDTARAQPGGPGPSMSALTMALHALWMREHLTDDGFARAYAPVEPVIPAASLA
jgi:hypothetical protein